MIVKPPLSMVAYPMVVVHRNMIEVCYQKPISHPVVAPFWARELNSDLYHANSVPLSFHY
jgi:hypothetical protein